MIDKISNSLFLIISNLAQVNSKQLLLNLFVDSLNDIFEETTFEWKEEKVGSNALLLNVGKLKYGYICFDNHLPDLEFSLLSNAVQMVAVFLNRLEQNSLLKIREEHLSHLVKERTKQLSISEERYRSLHINAGVSIILCNPNGKILSINEKAASFFGGKPDDITNKNVTDLFPPEEARRYISRFADVMKKQESIKYEDFVKLPTGDKWFRSIYSKIDSESGFIGIQIISDDITEKRFVEKKLLHSQDRLQLSLEANNASVFEYHLVTGKSIFTPDLFLSLGYTKEEIPTTMEGYKKLVHGEDVKVIDEALAHYLKGLSPFYYCQHRIRTKDNEWCWVSSQGKIFSYDTDNNPKVLVGISQDINFNKVAELAIMSQNDEIALQNEKYQALNEELHLNLEKIHKINIDMQLATEKAEESDRLKSAFLANMSHEIRTPLNAILGFSSLIALDDVSSLEKSQYAELIENGGTHLLRIIDDVIDISKIESNQLVIHRADFKLSVLFDEVEKTFEIDSKMRLKEHIELRCKRPPNIQQIRIFSDQMRIRQVFINLLTNSFKFTENGYIEFGVEKVNEKEIVFYVSDTGIGIDEESQNLVFDRFIQGKSDVLRDGTGLGLSITQGIIDLLGGKIWVESEVDKGSTFRFTIPFILK